MERTAAEDPRGNARGEAWRERAAGGLGLLAALLWLGAALLLAAPPESARDSLGSSSSLRGRPVALAADRTHGAERAVVDEVAAEVGAELGERPRVLLDASLVADAGLAARSALAPEEELWSIGRARPGADRTFVVETVAPPARALDAIRFPERERAGRAFVVSAVGDALEAHRLRVSVDGADVAAAVRARPERGEVEISVGPLEPGRHRIAVRHGDEPALLGALEVGDAPRVLLAGSADGLAARAVALQGFRPLAPGEEIAGAPPPDLVVVAGGGFDEERVVAAHRSGAGLLVVGGEALARLTAGPLGPELPARVRSADPRDAADAPPPEDPAPQEGEPLPPLPGPIPAERETTPPAPGAGVEARETRVEDDVPVVAVALVIDRSGSMGGDKIRLAKQAALATASMLAEDDYLAIITFADQSTVTFPADRVGSPLRIRRPLEDVVVGGGTQFYPALLAARDQLRRVPAGLRHVVLVTDGAAADRFTADFLGLLHGDYRQLGMHLSTVFIDGGGDQDRDFLGRLAQWGGGRSERGSKEEIPALVTTEIRRVTGLPPGGTRRTLQRPAPSRDSERRTPAPRVDPPPTADPPRVKPVEPTKPPSARRRLRVEAADGARIPEGIELAGLPEVDGFVALDLRRRGSLVLRGEPGAVPLLAVGASAHGSIAVLGLEESGGLDRWAGDPRLGALLGRIAAAVARAPRLEPVLDGLRAHVEDGEALLLGEDRLGLLGLDDGAPRRDLGGGVLLAAADPVLRGATAPSEGGFRTSSLAREAPRRASVDVLATVRAALTPPLEDGPSALGPSAGSAASVAPAVRALLAAGALCLLAGAVAARRA